MGKGEKKPRARNPIWDTIADIWYEGRVPKDQEKRVGRAVKCFVDRDATPDEIRRRHDRYRAWLREFAWNEISDCVEGVIKWWFQLAEDKASDDFQKDLFEALK